MAILGAGLLALCGAVFWVVSVDDREIAGQRMGQPRPPRKPAMAVEWREKVVESTTPASGDAEPQTPRRVVAGWVVDEKDRPVVDAKVFVGTFESRAVPGEYREITLQDGVQGGYLLHTDSEGHFTTELSALEEVLVLCMPQLHYVTKSEESAYWVRPPATALVFRVLRRGVATVRVKLRDADGAWADRFAVGWRLAREDGPAGSIAVEGGVAVLEIPISPDGRQRPLLCVGLTSHRVPEQRVSISAARIHDIEFDLRGVPEVRGQVIDPEGRPVEESVVFFGAADCLRDEGLEPPDPTRIPHAARSDALGMFVLNGRGDRVTAWAPGFSPATVRVGGGELLITLGRCGKIIAWVNDGSDSGVVTVDRAHVQKLVGSRAEFSGLGEGVHLIEWPDGAFELVMLEAGETATLEHDVLGDRLVRLRLAEGAEEGRGPGLHVGAMIGRGQGRRMRILVMRDREPTMSAVPDGEYWVLMSDGTMAAIHVSGSGRTELRTGGGSLRVEGDPDMRVVLVPAELSRAFDGWMLDRIGQRVGASGVLEWSLLPPGRFKVLSGSHVEIVDVGEGASVAVTFTR